MDHMQNIVKVTSVICKLVVKLQTPITSEETILKNIEVLYQL